MKLMKLYVPADPSGTFFNCEVDENAVQYMTDPDNLKRLGETLNSCVFPHSAVPPDIVYDRVKLRVNEHGEVVLHLPVLPDALRQVIGNSTVPSSEDEGAHNAHGGSTDLCAEMTHLSPFRENAPKRSLVKDASGTTLSPCPKKSDRRPTPSKNNERQPSSSNSTRRKLTMPNSAEPPANAKSLHDAERKSIHDKSTLIHYDEIHDECTDMNDGKATEYIVFNGVPDTFNETHFTKVLKKKLFAFEDLKDVEVLELLHDESNDTVTVKFASCRTASKVVECLPSFMYDEELVLSSLHFMAPKSPQKVASEHVTFRGVPDTFIETHFTKVLKKKLFAIEDLKDVEIVDLLHDESEGVVTVKFASCRTALKVVECLPSFMYDEELVLSSLHFMAPKSPQKVASEHVTFRGVPDTFIETHFTKVLKKKLFAIEDLRDVEILDLLHDESEGVVTVKFPSCRTASKVVECLPSFMYDEEVVTSSLYFMVCSTPKKNPVLSSCESINYDENGENRTMVWETKKKRSHLVIVQNVSPPFDTETFLSALWSAMYEAGNTFDLDCTGMCEKYNSEKRSVVVKFTCAEEASLATKLENLYYHGSKLKVQKYVEDFTPDGQESNEVRSESSDESISLDSDEGKHIFFNILLQCRALFIKNQKHGDALDKTRKALLKKGITATVPEIRNQRRKLREMYARLKSNGVSDHKLFKVCSVIFDLEDPTVLKGSEYDGVCEAADDDNTSEDDQYMQDLVKYSESATWTSSATKALITVCIDNKEGFLKPVNRNRYWQKVSTTLYEKNYVYGPDKCQKKIEKLCKEYRTYCQEAARTGAPGPMQMVRDSETREIMGLMDELEGDNVIANPKKTMSAGVENRDRTSHVGRVRETFLNRPSQHQRKLDLEERRVAAEERKADQLAAIAGKFSI